MSDEELIKRLRNYGHVGTVLEAADRIEALVKERDDLEAEAHAHIELWGKGLREKAAAEARAERLEAALRVIADGGDWASHDQQIARAALEPVTQPAPDAAAIREAALMTVPDEIELYYIIKASGAKKRIDVARVVSTHLEPMRRAILALLTEKPHDCA